MGAYHLARACREGACEEEEGCHGYQDPRDVGVLPQEVREVTGHEGACHRDRGACHQGACLGACWGDHSLAASDLDHRQETLAPEKKENSYSHVHQGCQLFIFTAKFNQDSRVQIQFLKSKHPEGK